ncbi:MAG: FHA domain-containing protein [Candidatus Eremiobacterota bacterium]
MGLVSWLQDRPSTRVERAKGHFPPVGEPRDGLAATSWTLRLPDGSHRPLPEGQTLTLGREKGVLVDSPYVSSSHLDVKVKGGQVLVRDRDTTNGTFLNGVKLPPNRWTPVEPGVRVQLSNDPRAVVRFQPESARPAPPSLDASPGPSRGRMLAAAGVGLTVGLGVAVGGGLLAATVPMVAVGVGVAAGLLAATGSVTVNGREMLSPFRAKPGDGLLQRVAKKLGNLGVRGAVGVAAGVAGTAVAPVLAVLGGLKLGIDAAARVAGAAPVGNCDVPNLPADPARYVFQTALEEVRVRPDESGAAQFDVVRLKIAPEQLSRRFQRFEWRDSHGNPLKTPPRLEKGLTLTERVGRLDHTRTYLGRDEDGHHMFGFSSRVAAQDVPQQLRQQACEHQRYERHHEQVREGVQSWGQSQEGNCTSVAVIKTGLRRFGPRIFQQCLPDGRGGYDITLRDGYDLNLSPQDIATARAEARWKGTGPSHELGVMAFAALARRGQQVGLKGARTYREALDALNSGMPLYQGMALMGLADYAARVSADELANGSQRATGFFAASDDHAVAAWQDGQGRWVADHYGQVVDFQGEDTNGRPLNDGYSLRDGI